ncbi:MAG TPA: M67 family metallopeptidase [Longimicrobiales bacterium]
MRGVVLAPALLSKLLAHVAEVYPLEGCGLLVGRREGEELRVTRVLPCPNVAKAEERAHRFVIDPRAVLNVERRLRGTVESIVGFYHSHPDAEARPSKTDMEYVRLWPRTAWLIATVEGGEARPPRAWWLDGPEGAAPRELEVRVAASAEALAPCPE